MADKNAAVTAALDAIARAIADAAAAIEAEADPVVALRLAGKLTETMRQHMIATAQIRLHAATRVHDARAMTLTALAGEIGVSKQRAGQIMQAARKSEEAG